MNEEAGEDGDAVPAQLPTQRARVLHVQDLPCHQEDDAKWEVPEETSTVLKGETVESEHRSFHQTLKVWFSDQYPKLRQQERPKFPFHQETKIQSGTRVQPNRDAVMNLWTRLHVPTFNIHSSTLIFNEDTLRKLKLNYCFYFVFEFKLNLQGAESYSGRSL